MIGLFDANGARLPILVEGLTFNDPNAALDDITEINSVRPATSIDYVSDPLQERDGLEVYKPRKIGRLVILDGVIRAPSIGALFDRIDTLASKLDPVILADTYPDEEGFVPLDFTTPSVSGDKACRYYVRTNKLIEPIITEYQPRQSALLSVEFLLRDPRRYLQASSTLAGAGVAVNAGNYKTWPTLTVTMAGPGSSIFEISNSTTGQSLRLDLSGRVNGDVVVVDMFRRSIKINGVETPSIQGTGDFFPLTAGNNTIAYANTANATVSLAWRSAFAV